MSLAWVIAGLALALQEPATLPPRAPSIPPSPPKLEFAGKPMIVPFSCTEEQLHAVGLACTEDEPCPVYLELAGLEAVGGQLWLTGNLHSAAATFSSILLVSEDGGASWTERHERIPQAVLEGIQFFDYQNGWAAGQLLATLPRDPFFLVTADGGKTWRRRPMFDESRVAAIEAFAFESAKDGALILDRSRSGEVNAKYESYETKTGGDTWMLREVTGKPMSLKRPRVSSAEYRLRADAASKAYRVERFQNGRWTLLASFLVRLPDCKIVDKEVAPPPEPTVPEPPKPSVSTPKPGQFRIGLSDSIPGPPQKSSPKKKP